jgi:hypothetical protein
MSLMSETSETPTVRSATATAPVPAAEPAPYVHKTPKVFLGAAWVAIVAGVVFIVSIIFFAGMALGHHGHGHHHHKHHAAFHHHPMGGPGGPGGPFGPPPFQQQGAPLGGAPSAPGPSQIPSSVAPSAAPTR